MESEIADGASLLAPNKICILPALTDFNASHREVRNTSRMYGVHGRKRSGQRDRDADAAGSARSILATPRNLVVCLVPKPPEEPSHRRRPDPLSVLTVERVHPLPPWVWR